MVVCFGFNARGGAGANPLRLRFALRFVPEHKINCGQLKEEGSRISNTTDTFAGTMLL